MTEPIRVLQVVASLNAGGMENYIMNLYRMVDKSKVQFDFVVHHAAVGLYEDEIQELGGKIYHFTVLDDKNVVKYISELNRFFDEHKEYQIIHGHLSSLAVFYLGVAKKYNVPWRIAHSHGAGFLHAMLFRVLVGLYSCVYVAQKNAKKIAYTSISAAIINIAVDLILINKIQVFAASLSTLIAFLSMFIVRYIDVNKTVHMKIRKPIIIGSVLIGGMLIGTYYCGNRMIQFAALCITAVYAVLTNVDMLKSGVNLVKSRLGK